MLEHFPEAQEQYDGRNTVLIFEEGMRNMLKDALKKQDFSKDAAVLAKAAAIIRKIKINVNYKLASLSVRVYFTTQRKVDPVLLAKQGTQRYASHLFQCTYASMFMRRSGARNSSNSYTRWVSASHMTEL